MRLHDGSSDWEGYLHGCHGISEEPDSSVMGGERRRGKQFLNTMFSFCVQYPRSLEDCQHGGSVTCKRQEDKLTTHLLSWFGFREENLCNESPSDDDAVVKIQCPHVNIPLLYATTPWNR